MNAYLSIRLSSYSIVFLIWRKSTEEIHTILYVLSQTLSKLLRWSYAEKTGFTECLRLNSVFYILQNILQRLLIIPIEFV